jgi:uncharacterized protein (DUF2249 family)/hemerythrin-like domain-containing protein
MVPRRNEERQPLPREIGQSAAGSDHAAAQRRLADEHAVLLTEVRGREAGARAALGAGRWPGQEIQGLVDYLRYEVLDQAVTEERLLFPLTERGFADSRIHRLVDDHVQLRDLTHRLASAAAATGADREPTELVALLGALDEFLDRHMRAEEELLSTTASGVESLRRPFRCHLWFPLTEGPEFDLDDLPPEFAIRAALERFARLRPRERLVVSSGTSLDPLWSLVSSGRPGEYGWVYLEEGPERWSAELTRRAPS